MLVNSHLPFALEDVQLIAKIDKHRFRDPQLPAPFLDLIVRGIAIVASGSTSGYHRKKCHNV